MKRKTMEQISGQIALSWSTITLKNKDNYADRWDVLQNKIMKEGQFLAIMVNKLANMFVAVRPLMRFFWLLVC